MDSSEHCNLLRVVSLTVQTDIAGAVVFLFRIATFSWCLTHICTAWH